jgi:hypothetical protein
MAEKKTGQGAAEDQYVSQMERCAYLGWGGRRQKDMSLPLVSMCQRRGSVRTWAQKRMLAEISNSNRRGRFTDRATS